jgi:integrase/recombinase XerD
MKNLDEAIASFLFHCEFEKRLSTKTLKAYSIDLKQLTLFLENKHDALQIECIDKHTLRPYIQWLSQFKPKTMKRKVATSKAMFNYLEFEEVIEVSPFRKMRIRIKEPQHVPTTMTKREIQKLFRYVYGLRAAVAAKSEYAQRNLVRDIAVLELLYATGIRVSELCSLQPFNIDLTSGLVKVMGKGQKERHIHIGNAEVKAALREYARGCPSPTSRPTFFVNRLGAGLSSQSVRFMIRGYAERANIGKHITPHTFRHTFATLLLEEDVDIKYIQSFLGHSSIMTTQIYTRVNRSKERRILVSKHPRRGLVLG